MQTTTIKNDLSDVCIKLCAIRDLDSICTKSANYVLSTRHALPFMARHIFRHDKRSGFITKLT